MDESVIKDVEVIPPEQAKNLTKSSGIVKRDLRKYLDADTIKERLSNICVPRDKMFITVLWMTGIRVTEAISLKKSDLDFQNKEITIKWQKNRKNTYRIVPIPEVCAQILQFYTAGMNLEERLFPFTRQWGFQIVQHYLHVSPHKLRHSYAVHCLRQGMDIIYLHKLLGHSRIQTTMEYLKIVPTDQAKELNKIKW